MSRKDRISRLERVNGLSNQITNKPSNQEVDITEKMVEYQRQVKSWSLDKLYSEANRLRPRHWGRK
jgi:hypothetical protein